MSKTIERSVVEMQFDNSNFERNVQQSMSTIDKLKEKLSFDNSDKALKGLERAANNVDLSGLAGTIETISSKFSTMGIVGMTTVSRITNELLSGLGRITSSIKELTITGGINRAMNIEKAKFQLQGLGIEWEKVSDAIDYAVTNTAYSMDAAAQAASQLSAAGLDYENVIFVHESDQKELTQMSMSLRAVSGVAAQTQSDYAAVARYFQDVANAGKVTGSTLTYMTQVLNLPVEQNLAEGLQAIADGSFEASEAVKENVKKIVGNTQVSAEKVKELCKKGLIDYDTFATIMFNKYADHAVDANKTLEGVTANIRSAFARIGAEFMSPIIANEGPLVSMLEKVRVKTNDLKKAITPLAQKSAQYVSEALDGIAAFIDKIDISSGLGAAFEKAEYAVEQFAAIFKNLVPQISSICKIIKRLYNQIFPKKSVDDFKKSFDKFTDKLKSFKISAEALKKIENIFKGLFTAVSLGIKVFKNFLTVIKPVIGFLLGSIGKIFKGASNIGEKIQSLNKGTTIFNNFSDAAEKLEDVFYSIGWTIESVFSNFRGEFDGTQTLVEKFGQSAIDVFTGILYTITDLVEAVTGLDLTNVEDQIEVIWQTLTNSFHDFYDRIQENGGGIKGLAITIWEVIKELGRKLADWIKETTGIDLYNLQEKVQECAEKVKASFGNFLEEFKPLEKARDIIDGLTNSITNLLDTVKKMGSSAGAGISKLLENPFLTLEAVARSTSIKNFADAIRKIANQGLASTISGITNPLNNLKLTLSQFQKELKAQQLAAIAGALVGFAVAIGILAGAVMKLSEIEDFQSLLEGLFGVLILGLGMMIILMQTMDSASNTMLKTFNKVKKALTLTQQSSKISAAKIIAIGITFVIIASAVSKLAETVGELTKLDIGHNIGSAIAAIIVMLASMALLTIEFMALIQLMKQFDIQSKDIRKVLQVAVIFVILAKATEMMAEAITIMQGMNIENWPITLLSFFEVIGLMAALVGTVTLIRVPDSKGFVKSMASLFLISMAVSKLVEAINTLNTEDPLDTIFSFGIVILALDALMSSAFMVSGRSISLKTSIGLLAIAVSMAILCKEVKKLAAMPIKDIAKGFVVLWGILGTFSVLATAFKAEMKSLIQAGVAMFLFAEALNVVSKAIERMAQFNIETVAMNLGLLVVSMYMMTEMLKRLAQEDDMLKGAVAMVALSGSLWILANALTMLGGIPWKQTAANATVLVSAMLALVGILRMLEETDKFLKGAIAMAALAGTLWIVANALTMLGGIPWKETAANGLILIGILAALAVMAKVMEGNLAGAASILILAGAILAISFALKMLAGQATAKELWTVIGAITGFIVILGVLAAIASAAWAPLLIGAAVIAGVSVIFAAGLAAIGGALMLLGIALGNISVSVASAAEGLGLLGDVIIKLGVSFAMYKGPLKEFTATIFKFAGIAFTMGAGLVVLGAGAAVAGVGFVALGVGSLALAAGLWAVGAALDYILPKLGMELSNDLKSNGGLLEQAGQGLTNSIAKGITSGAEQIKQSAAGLATDAKNSFNGELGISSPSAVFMESGMNIDLGLSEGMLNNSDMVTAASSKLGELTSTSLIDELAAGTQKGEPMLEETIKKFSSITETGSQSAGANTGAGFIKGLSSQRGSIMNYASGLAKAAMNSMRSYLKIKSPSRVAMEIGEYTGEGFSIGMLNTESNIEDSAADLGKTAEQSLTTALSSAYENLTSDVSDPTITPVLDLSQIQNGVSSIDSMLSRDYASDISANYKTERDRRQEESEVNNEKLAGMNDQLVSAIAANNMSDLPISVNIQLVGDADGVFRLVMSENQRWVNMTGSSPLMRG